MDPAHDDTAVTPHRRRRRRDRSWMRRIRILVFSTTIAWVTAASTEATLVDHGFYFTDTATGLQWLDYSQTNVMEYQDANWQLLAAEGWRLATSLEVVEMWERHFNLVLNFQGPGNTTFFQQIFLDPTLELRTRFQALDALMDAQLPHDSSAGGTQQEFYGCTADSHFTGSFCQGTVGLIYFDLPGFNHYELNYLDGLTLGQYITLTDRFLWTVRLPEPSMLLLLGSMMGVVLCWKRRRGS